MENKYYKPQVEDLFVGYEICWIKDPTVSNEPNNLIKLIISPAQLSGMLYPNRGFGNNMDEGYTPDLWSFVTEYLTKEQIEAEGWESVRKDYYTKMDEGHPVFLQVNYDWEGQPVFISIGYNNEYPRMRYVGICPSINEFRTIIKLLKIA